VDMCLPATYTVTFMIAGNITADITTCAGYVGRLVTDTLPSTNMDALPRSFAAPPPYHPQTRGAPCLCATAKIKMASGQGITKHCWQEKKQAGENGKTLGKTLDDGDKTARITANRHEKAASA